ncbi:energy transducer TonB [Rhodanobacter sp. FW510-R12]|uniref:energy transducer TonB n=1 Tax=unclassified Rhodanobacter TaxID=2621553 RepID=UPI0007A9BB61|nr:MULTISPECIES: energy transducer TonB [unclassified Rhodanobacter]KZC17831.1 energy transducer TonB [Rhodanobacter sp. FW104-R8]KZC27164.1 energy transducer TonB [Rhodanobacter sp. FW510-T8]KZC31602.1 energy transducer TonB [Rhodanobacter sp. FW510-R10]
MKRVLLGVVILLLAGSLTAQAAEERAQIYEIGADVDARGHITAVQVDPDVPASIAALLATSIKQWQFTPATINGQPVPAHTFIRTRLQASPNASGQYDLRISYMGNGPRLDNRAPPIYPTDAIRRRLAAFVILDATVQPDGHLTDMRVSNKFADWPSLPSFKLAVLAAAKQWHAIPEQVDGRPVTTRLRIPFVFTVQGQSYTEQQARILRDAARMDAAAADARTAQSAIPLPSEQEVALDSPLHPSAVATITNAP